MNISSNLRETALQEFEFTFGGTVREFEENSEIYGYLVEQFLKGVEYGLTHFKATVEEFKIEAAVRYESAKTGLSLGENEREVSEKILRCSTYVFLYGTGWGHNLVNGVGLDPLAC